MKEKSKMKLKVTQRILKFNPGSDPEKDEPDEIVEKSFLLEGDEAKQILKQAVT